MGKIRIFGIVLVDHGKTHETQKIDQVNQQKTDTNKYCSAFYAFRESENKGHKENHHAYGVTAFDDIKYQFPIHKHRNTGVRLCQHRPHFIT